MDHLTDTSSGKNSHQRGALRGVNHVRRHLQSNLQCSTSESS